ncbi:MAG: thioredoxin family protein [Clostridia bacterium]|nr:thioredoxin family protein [Clostridia bacterium]MDD4375686.1 thioredoxin family protein [Clostridia bacterium]
MSKDRKILITLLLVIILLLSFTLIYLNTDLFKKTEVGEIIDKNVSDSIRFYREYPSVKEANNFYYASYDEVINVLTKGTGIVFFGFPSCKWCQAYVPVLNEVAVENGINKIYYYNIREIREENTDEYKNIVKIISGYLDDDENGNKRIYVPDAYFVKGGIIKGNNNDMSTITSAIKVEEYFTEDIRKELKQKLIGLAEEIQDSECDDDIKNNNNSGC